MLRIEHVSAELDVRPADAGTDRPLVASVPGSIGDPHAREEMKALVREALRDYLRELERQGIV